MRMSLGCLGSEEFRALGLSESRRFFQETDDRGETQADRGSAHKGTEMRMDCSGILGFKVRTSLSHSVVGPERSESRDFFSERSWKHCR